MPAPSEHERRISLDLSQLLDTDFNSIFSTPQGSSSANTGSPSGGGWARFLKDSTFSTPAQQQSQRSPPSTSTNGWTPGCSSPTLHAEPLAADYAGRRLVFNNKDDDPLPPSPPKDEGVRCPPSPPPPPLTPPPPPLPPSDTSQVGDDEYLTPDPWNVLPRHSDPKSTPMRSIPQWMVEEASLSSNVPSTCTTPPHLATPPRNTTPNRFTTPGSTPIATPPTLATGGLGRCSNATASAASTPSGMPTLLARHPAHPPPEHEPPSLVPVTLHDIEQAEAFERRQMERQVFPRKHLMLTLVTTYATDWYMVSALLPDSVWDHDNVRLALALAVLRGDPAGVERILTSTAFAGFHRLRLRTDGEMDDMHGLGFDHSVLVKEGHVNPVPGCQNFMQLALRVCVKAMNDHCSKRDMANRAEVLKLLINSRYSCFDKVRDIPALLAVQQHSDYRRYPCLSDTLDYWKPVLLTLDSRCSYDECPARGSADSDLSGQLYAFMQTTLKWDPSTHQFFPRPFRARAKSVVRVLGKTALQIIPFLPWVVEGLTDPNFPVYTVVKDYVSASGRVEPMHASPAALREFQQYCKSPDTPPIFCGQRIAASLVVDKSGVTKSLTGTLLGTKYIRLINGTEVLALMWRRQGGLGAEPVLRAQFKDGVINPISVPGRKPPSGGAWWYCGLCDVLNKDRTPCSRCCNAHSSVLALEGQRRKPHDRAPVQGLLVPTYTPPITLSSLRAPSVSAATISTPPALVPTSVPSSMSSPPPLLSLPPSLCAKRPTHPLTPSGSAAATGSPHILVPFRCVNASARTPHDEVFEAAPERLALWGVYHGQHIGVVTDSGRHTGLVVGIGPDGALYWASDSGVGAERLATSLKAFKAMHPTVLE